MKKVLLSVITICFSICLSAQFVQLGNTPFRTFLLNKYPACFNASQELDTTCTAIITETSLDLSNQVFTSVYGLNFFDNLRSLNLSNTQADNFDPYLPSSLDTLNLASGYGLLYSYPPHLKWLDVSNTYSNGQQLTYLPASLEYFNAANSSIIPPTGFSFSPLLKYINISHCTFYGLSSLPPSLDTLICDNQFRDVLSSPTLTVLPSLPATLKYLDCSGNGVSNIPNLPAGLKYLNCSNQTMQVNSVLTYEEIPALGVLPPLPAGLTYLNCSHDAFGGLGVLPATLTYLDCSYNQFSHPVFDGISTTTYSSAGIPNFPSLPAGLTFLNAGGNRMTALPSLPAGLIDLSVSDMNIGSIPPLPLTLRFLDVSGNAVSCLPTLPPSLLLQSPFRTLAAELIVNSNIKCLPNRLQGLRIKSHISSSYVTVSLPVCNFFNNPDDCPVAPTMTGLCFYDNNSNGIQDAGELPMGGVKVSLNNGEEAFSSDNGIYAIGGELGLNNLTVTTRPYYTAVPAAISYNFSRYDTVVNAIIALKPNAVVDSLKITITSVDPARPGFPFSYQVKFENVGTTSMPNAVVHVVFDNTKMQYQSSSPGVSVAGNTLTFNAGTLSVGQRGEFTSNFLLNETVELGSQIIATANITSGANVFTDVFTINVQGSFDPNEKYATKTLTTQEVQNGAYIDYVVCFQNTGTDTAFNVQILDELDPQLDATSFMPVASSHPCISKRSGKYLSFDFANILLPDSNVNEPASHGYVRFRVKPKTVLPLNTNIPNTAGIYFDFNVPVVTNTASTLVNLGTVPVTLTDFTAQLQNKYVKLDWKTAQEINSRNFIVERSGSNRQWKTIINLPASGNSQLTSFYDAIDYTPLTGINYYRLRMNDLDGAYTYSPIRPVVVVKEGTINVSPNPAHQFALLTANESMIGATIIVADQFGRKLYTGKVLSTGTKLNTSLWQPGIYYINVLQKGSTVAEKLVVQ